MVTSKGDKVLMAINYGLLAAVVLFMFIPFWYLIVMSFNEGVNTAAGGILLFPRAFTLDNYRAVFANSGLFGYFGLSFLRVFVGTPLHMLVVFLAAWAISRRDMPFRKFFIATVLVSMFVSGGLIPFYLALAHYNLLNTFWVFVLPGAFSGWNMIIMVTAIRSLPASLTESAQIDGANELTLCFRIVFPLIGATIATLSLFTAVFYWNDWFAGAFFVNRQALWPIATYLQMVLQRGLSTVRSAAEADAMGAAGRDIGRTISESSIRATTLVVSMLPIICIYPFVQKYFIHGVMIGSIKE